MLYSAASDPTRSSDIQKSRMEYSFDGMKGF